MTETDPNSQRFTADSVERAMAVIGDRWTFLILREAFFGVRRFSQLARNLGITRNLLARRLESLVEAGVLDRTIYNQRADWHEYRLTDRGRDLYDIVLAALRWGDKHLAGPEGPPLLLRHNPCGHDTQGITVCEHCRQPIDPHDITPRPGPGAMVDRPGAPDRARPPCRAEHGNIHPQ